MDPHTPPTIEAVCEQAIRLPSAPSLMPRLIAVLEDHNAGAEDIEKIICLDTALSAATLRLSNSAFFGAGHEVSSVAEAVIRLGQREIYRLAALALVNRWGAGPERDAYGGDPGDFCRHALCTALAAEVLAEKSGAAEPQVAYTAGLVCDIGKLAVAYSCLRFFPDIRARQAASGCTWSQAETLVLGYDQTQVGARLLKQWRFPSILVMAAEYCNRPDKAPEEAKSMVAILHAAKFLATSFGPGVSDEGFLFEVHDDVLSAAGFTPSVLESALPVVLERASSRLHDRLTHGAVSI